MAPHGRQDPSQNGSQLGPQKFIFESPSWLPFWRGFGGQESPIDICLSAQDTIDVARRARSLWDPLIYNFQRAQSPDNKAKQNTHTVQRAKARNSTVATVLLHQYFCNSTVVTVLLQQYCCSSTVATVLLQQYCCNSTRATVLLQNAREIQRKTRKKSTESS